MPFFNKLLGKLCSQNPTAPHYPKFAETPPCKSILDQYVGGKHSLLVVGPIGSVMTEESTGVVCQCLDATAPSLTQVIKAKSGDASQILVLSAWFEHKENIHRIARKLAPHYSNLIIFYADKGRFPEASKLSESLLTRNKFISKFVKSYTLTEELYWNSLGIYFFQRTK